MTGSTFCFFFLCPLPLEAVGGVAVATGAAPSFAFISTSMITGSSFFTTGGDRSGLTSGGCSSVRNESQKSSEEHEKVFCVAVRVMMVLVRVFWMVYESFCFWMVFSSGTAKTSCTYMLSVGILWPLPCTSWKLYIGLPSCKRALNIFNTTYMAFA